ncbi:MAG: type IV pili methyl-accepting chemotaxis transducer N-terminal domain-containing protein [Yoonia sp.]|uniref:type IV pili methyl-accepting chemotaxis transducer N-terminal domain-containing protein n=1 Tax=Yoonia sp. TaxID=2212373 RepID=UPI003EF460CA
MHSPKAITAKSHSTRSRAAYKSSLSAACLALAIAATPSVGLLSPAQAVAQSIDNELYNGGKARVSRSASLRSLTQAVASASCRTAAGIGAESAQRELGAARESFASILDGLINGSPALGMPGAEQRARTIQALQETQEMWSPLNAAASQLASGSGSDADAATIRDNVADVFDQTVTLAATISGQYSDPQQLLQSDATVLNFAIRQRALAYSMTRSMCELATNPTPEAREQLRTDTELFDRSLIALRDGFPPAGINPPPNEIVLNSLNAAYELWSAERDMFNAAIAGETPTPDDVVRAASLSTALSKQMNNAITLYLIASPGQDGVYRVPLEAYARDELSQWLGNPDLITAIKAQNDAHADLTEDGVIALDQQWRAEAGEGGGPLITKLLSDPMSTWLLAQQKATAGFVTEVFVMDNKGLNVAQSVETSDYWQGDEAKWQQTYSVGPDALHISEVEFDDSTGFYQSQASLPITDPATGEVIGAVTFGINIQNLM